ncbi:hypothetical protein M0802_002745 [Mischocyttarus mexicanus]|nr:hypothetical protein M0802_002745 [Mischocyttarus mexicanus]
MIVQLLTIFLILHVSQANDDCPNILTKAAWGGRTAKDINYLILPIPYVIIHHTVTPECHSRNDCSKIVQSIQSHHMDNNGWNDIGYSFLVGGDGNVYEGAGWTKEGAHTYGYNKRSLGISFIGNFEDKDASNQMLEAGHKLIRCGISKGVLRDDVNVVAAKQIQSTLSPGNRLYLQIQSWQEWSNSHTNN